ncbi:hypothetical protein CY35_20G002000 [Sphagnum magellanicum]|jgi:hypothetical protein|nr:hypothetical protein CY35_20G002000 [Sphagnum magellanicum]KAH9530455.1 hypothetical protein CY35_20G002000 [Sphagnum magellanicum]
MTMVGVIETVAVQLEAAPAPEKNIAAANRRVKRLERPNRAALDEQIIKLYSQVDAAQVRVHEIKTILDRKQQNKHFTSQEHLDARSQLSDLSATFRGVLESKKALREELEIADRERERRRGEAWALRDKLPYVRVEQIDEEIKKLEYRLSHTSLTLQEEKKVLQQIKDLTKSRDFVKDYTNQMENMSHDEGSRSALVEKIKEKDQLLNSLKDQEQQQRKILADIREKEASQTVDIPALIDERNAAFEKMKALRDEVKELRAEFQAKEDEFWEREHEWKEQRAVERKLAYKKREAERRERDEVRKQRELLNFVEPYTDEIILCDQLSSYLQKYSHTPEETPAPSQKAEILAPKGVGDVIQCKKNRNDEELEGWFAGYGVKGKGKGKKGRAPQAPKGREKERISLSLDALTSFEKVALSPPTIIGDAAKSIEDLKAKKENFLKLQRMAREAREDGIEVESKKAQMNGNSSRDNPEMEDIEVETESKEVKNVLNGEPGEVDAASAYLSADLEQEKSEISENAVGVPAEILATAEVEDSTQDTQKLFETASVHPVH